MFLGSAASDRANQRRKSFPLFVLSLSREDKMGEPFRRRRLGRLKLPQFSTQVWKRGGVEIWKPRQSLKIVNAAASTVHNPTQSGVFPSPPRHYAVAVNSEILKKESLASLAFSTGHSRREKEKKKRKGRQPVSPPCFRAL